MSTIKEVIVELTFSLELVIEAIGTSIGGGMKFSFIMLGEVLAELLDWLSKTFIELVQALVFGDFSFPRFPVKKLSELLFIGIEFYGKLAAVPAVSSTLIPSSRVDIGLLIRANLATFGLLLGVKVGSWKLEFGIRAILPINYSSLFISRNSSSCNLWILKGSLYGK
jgi:hypothetical protein